MPYRIAGIDVHKKMLAVVAPQRTPRAAVEGRRSRNAMLGIEPLADCVCFRRFAVRSHHTNI